MFIDTRDIRMLGVGREREIERETSMSDRNINWLLPYTPQSGDKTCNTGMCPDWGLTSHPFGVLENAPTNRATLAKAGKAL